MILNKTLLFGKTHPATSLGIIAVIVVIISSSIPETTRELSLLKTLMMALLPLGFMYGVNKNKLRWPRQNKSKNKSILHWSVYMIAIAAVVGASALYIVANTQTLQAMVPESFDNIMHLIAASSDSEFWATFILFCFFTGVFEEVFFRGILLESLIAGFSKTPASKTAFWRKKETGTPLQQPYEGGFRELLSAAILSSLIFSLFHIQGTGSSVFPGDSVNAFITIFKVLQTAIFSFFMSALYLKTKSLLPCVLTHALIDILLLAPNALSTGLFAGNNLTGTVFDMALLGTCAILFLPLVFVSYRTIKNIEVPYQSLFVVIRVEQRASKTS